ncbi:acetyl-CoA carboxylase carboxyltransferase subunit alpha [Gloeobacter kilaueensis]|uniref:Acetyl-coenzyme A carboxylase carboxyl transferase subunit alpha n=1 Tax=Gloeobacter kilaueensis (strain ATCC BAA-2537 / CCAP 1431/1 / ULC 316 / JS1) TaxID=1183438 RepID=U5QFX0_GLOK1|nr:acetyl-CoA carboxylase carboxyltransferase subunit alpha [Gloeobacter kilaueensis]AGY57793.1 acetyl-CoA carboxylase carboxyltransferase subunit alpha [Gloeobacter kilaueensis JS1]
MTQARTAPPTPSIDFEREIRELQERIAQIRRLAAENNVDVSDKLGELEARLAELQRDLYANLTPAEVLKVARNPKRPSTLDYIQLMCEDWIELHGDRLFGDDLALVGGLARLGDRPVVILGHQKGRDTKDNIQRNFGCPHPEGYRKALRLMDHANRFGLPIIALIDTAGAHAGVEAEQRGQGEAIARNLQQMFSYEVPILCAVIGEGGSGGAIAIGVGNRMLMLEYAVYSVIAPDSCSVILWRDKQHIEQAATALKITARDLKQLGIIDEIVSEPPGGAHSNPQAVAASLKEALLRHLNELVALDGPTLRSERYEKFRALARFQEV